MSVENADTEELLGRAGSGDRAALDRLLSRHRHRLRQMASVRMDRRLAARADASDIVQEAITDAAARLPEYLRRRPAPFYLWLRQLAWQRLVDRLLASVHFGERWGRHWLDVARYADTKGYVFREDRNYPKAFTYRDWVIRAFFRMDWIVSLVSDFAATRHESICTPPEAVITYWRPFLMKLHWVATRLGGLKVSIIRSLSDRVNSERSQPALPARSSF